MNLNVLDLENNRITEAGLEQLRELTTLEELRLKGTVVSEEAGRQLSVSLANCNVYPGAGFRSRVQSSPFSAFTFALRR